MAQLLAHKLDPNLFLFGGKELLEIIPWQPGGRDDVAHEVLRVPSSDLFCQHSSIGQEDTAKSAPKALPPSLERRHHRAE